MRLQCISLASGKETAIPPKTLLCLGNFDGVHLGHRALIAQAGELRTDWFPKAALCVFCFSKPSGDYLSASPLPHLSTLAQKLKLFADCGAEYAILAEFAEIRNLSPTAFVREVLVNACNAVAAVCGFNYRFGKGGAGTPKLLGEMIPTSVCAEVRDGDETVSSTRIRRLIAEGSMEEATRLLGRPYAIESTVVHGKSLGHKLGFPTVNQEFPAEMTLPPQGVYVTACRVDGQTWRAVSNVGVRPTVDDHAPLNCETHLLDCNADLYGKTAEVSFLHFLRPERKFASLEELTRQVDADIAAARGYKTN